MNRSKWYMSALTAVGALAFMVFVPVAEAQQTGTVSGSVTELGSGRPLRGVQLYIPSGRCPGIERSCPRVTAVTDEAGQFTMANVPAGEVEIRARLVGFSSRSVTIPVVAGQSIELNFELRVSVISLDEIVVTGAGVEMAKKQLGNTIATLNPDDIVRTRSVMTFSETLSAREPGVSVKPSGGIAGESARIEIRGTSSMSMRNIPVIYVDGVRIDNGRTMFIASSGSGGRGRPMDDINPDAIERIEVLKGAAAATLYGSEANAGVIQIFTKKGTAGAPRINFNISAGFSQVPKSRIKLNSGFADRQSRLDNMNGIFKNEIQKQLGRPANLFEVVEVPILADLYGNGANYVVSTDVSGGSEDFQYFVSGRWTEDDGPIDAEDLGPGARDNARRLNATAQFTLFPRDRLSVRLSTQFTDFHQESPPNNNNIYGFISSATFGKPQRANCDNSTIGPGDGTCTGAGNPTGQRAFATTRETAQRFIEGDQEHFTISSTVTYEPSQTVNLNLTFGTDFTNQNNWDFRPFANDVDDFTNVRDKGVRWAGSRNNREITLDGRATWTERFGNISSQLVVGGQGFISRNKNVWGRGRDFPGPGLEVLGAAALPLLGEGFSEQVNIGLLFQEQIGINDWIYVTGGGRWDRNSAFGDSTSGQFYPKVNASIIPSDLPSWSSSTISSLRFRAAFGKSGQQPGAFDRFTTFNALAATTGPGIQPRNLGNALLKPEVSKELEFGGEVGFLNDRVGLDLTYWTRTTEDALVARRFPVSGGFSRSQLDNIGLMEASGFEIKFNALAVDAQNLTIDVFANGAFLSEKIASMGGAPLIKSGGSYSRYRNFYQGPDTLAAGITCAQISNPICSNEGGVNVQFYAPLAHLGGRLIPTCDQGAVYSAGTRAGQARTCWTPGSTVPYDLDRDGVPDTEASFRAALPGLTTIDSPDPMRIMVDDEDDDGNTLDNYLGKPTPDWAGAFGANVTLWQNLQVNALFEYRAGEYFINNLTDGFRNANPLIGRNTPKGARAEAAIENPAATVDEKFAAAMQWATELVGLRPYSGINMIKNAKFIRFRELGVTYTASRSFAQKLGLNNLSFNLSGRNLQLWTPYDGVDPELNASTADGLTQGIEAFGTGIPRRYAFSIRFGF